MKRTALFMAAACAMLLSAQPVFAALTTCDDWVGNWTFKYTTDGTNYTCDNVTIPSVCKGSGQNDGTAPACMPTKPNEAPQWYWYCVARGKRHSDNKTIQFRQISFDSSKTWSYYEKTDEEIFILGGDTPADFIPPTNFTKGDDNTTKFIVDNGQPPPLSPPPVANTGIACGIKPRETTCVACDAVPCTLNIIPGTVRKLVRLVEPISAIIFIGDGNADIVAGDKPVFTPATTAIIPLISLRLGTKLMISIVFINPLSPDKGTYTVTIGECTGQINVK